MRKVRFTLLLALLPLFAAAPLQAQRGALDITADLLDRFLRAYDAEKEGVAGLESQLAEVDAKLQRFRECKENFETAADASGSRLGGLAAKLAIKGKCGATSDEGILKERAALLQGPEKAALKAGGFGKAAEYAQLKERITAYLQGDRSGFTQGALDLLASRSAELSSHLGIVAAAEGGAGGGAVARRGGGGGGRGVRAPNVWTNDYAWEFIGQLFAVTYLSGATIFEKPYQPGQWTRWKITEADTPGESQTFERAFLFKTADGSEWWRLKTINNYQGDDGKATADTVVLEALFKPADAEGQVKQLVRMRGLLPGNPEPQELMVPSYMTMLSVAAAFPFKPTPESIEGATVGTESLTTPAGTFSAKHVRFGTSGGTNEWWLSDSTPGGWVRFQAKGQDKEATYTMELVGTGTGAKSELGAR